MTGTAEFMSREMVVEPGWIDYNGHMNMAYYSVLFDRGVDDIYETLGFGPGYLATQGHTTYMAEFHIRYLRELHEGDRVTVSFRLIDVNDRSLHSYQEMRHSDGWLAATGEALSLHVDMSGPRVAPYPADILSRLEAVRAEHAALPRPDHVGKGIAVRHRR